MIYTNKVLEMSSNNKGRKLELFTMYPEAIRFLKVNEKVNNKIKFVKDKFNSSLSFDTKGKFPILIEDKNDDRLFLVLDTLDYKYFNSDGKLYSEAGQDYALVYQSKFTNKSRTSSWTISILEVPKYFSQIYYMKTTSGADRYITIFEGRIKMHTGESLKKYLVSNNITIANEIDWYEIKR